MIQKIITIIFLFFFPIAEFSGQTFSKEYWKEIAEDSDAVILGTVEKRLQLIRPECYKSNPDSNCINPKEFIVGEIFQVKFTKRLKGKIISIKEGNEKYLYIFDAGGYGLHNVGMRLIKGKEFLFFLKQNTDNSKFVGLETIEYKPNSQSIRAPFEAKPIYTVVYGTRGIVQIKPDNNKLVKEIKEAID